MLPGSVLSINSAQQQPKGLLIIERLFDAVEIVVEMASTFIKIRDNKNVLLQTINAFIAKNEITPQNIDDKIKQLEVVILKDEIKKGEKKATLSYGLNSSSENNSIFDKIISNAKSIDEGIANYIEREKLTLENIEEKIKFLDNQIKTLEHNRKKDKNKYQIKLLQDEKYILNSIFDEYRNTCDLHEKNTCDLHEKIKRNLFSKYGLRELFKIDSLSSLKETNKKYRLSYCFVELILLKELKKTISGNGFCPEAIDIDDQKFFLEENLGKYINRLMVDFGLRTLENIKRESAIMSFILKFVPNDQQEFFKNQMNLESDVDDNFKVDLYATISNQEEPSFHQGIDKISKFVASIVASAPKRVGLEIISSPFLIGRIVNNIISNFDLPFTDSKSKHGYDIKKARDFLLNQKEKNLKLIHDIGALIAEILYELNDDLIKSENKEIEEENKVIETKDEDFLRNKNIVFKLFATKSKIYDGVESVNSKEFVDKIDMPKHKNINFSRDVIDYAVLRVNQLVANIAKNNDISDEDRKKLTERINDFFDAIKSVLSLYSEEALKLKGDERKKYENEQIEKAFLSFCKVFWPGYIEHLKLIERQKNKEISRANDEESPDDQLDGIDEISLLTSMVRNGAHEVVDDLAKTKFDPSKVVHGDLDGLLAKYKEQLDALNQENSKLRKENDKNNGLQNEILSLKTKLNKEIEKNTELAESYLKAMNNFSQSALKNEDLSKNVNDLNKKNKFFEEDNVNLRAYIEYLEGENQRLQNENEQLKNNNKQQPSSNNFKASSASLAVNQGPIPNTNYKNSNQGIVPGASGSQLGGGKKN